MMETFGQRLKKAIKNKKMTLSQLSDEIGWHKESISLWCRDKNSPSALALQALCEALDVSADYMLWGSPKTWGVKK